MLHHLLAPPIDRELSTLETSEDGFCVFPTNLAPLTTYPLFFIQFKNHAIWFLGEEGETSGHHAALSANAVAWIAAGFLAYANTQDYLQSLPVVAQQAHPTHYIDKAPFGPTYLFWPVALPGGYTGTQKLVKIPPAKYEEICAAFHYLDCVETFLREFT